MLNSRSPQQQATSQQPYPLIDAAVRRFEQQAKGSLRGHEWICGGCGMTHSVILPEECENCGATALEFQYVSDDASTHFSA